MSWLLLALAATFLWSICNFIDKLVIDRFVPERSVALALGVYSAIFSAILLPFIWYFNQNVFATDPLYIALFIGTGVLEIAAITFYLRALQHEDTSTVIPFFQSVPVFSFILGFFLLGEALSTQQLAAGSIIIVGGILLSLDLSSHAKHRIRLPLVGLMLTSSFLYALFDAAFKYGALRETFWTAVFWQHTGIVLCGILILAVRKRNRTRFMSIVKGEGAFVASLNVSNEALYAGGMMLSNYALLLAPIALVSLVNVYQPVFVFLMGIVLSLCAPRLIKENLSHSHIIPKAFAIGIIVVASMYLISTSV